MGSIGGWEYSCCNTPLFPYLKTIALQLHKHEYSGVGEITNTSEVVLPLAIILTKVQLQKEDKVQMHTALAANPYMETVY